MGTRRSLLEQIEAHFQKTGAFSNGLVTEGQLPSVSGHSSSRIRNLLTAKQMLGDDEQYAVSMSLMLRHLGIPSRVVLGFYPDPTSPENGADEVRITGKALQCAGQAADRTRLIQEPVLTVIDDLR